MRVALDEQIFAIQPFGGISRMFAELGRQFLLGQPAGVDLLPLRTPIVNRYVLDDEVLREGLCAKSAPNSLGAIAQYLSFVGSGVQPDIVHNTFYLPRGLERRKLSKRIVTVHDMIPELMPRTRRRLDFLTLKQRYVEAADHVICVSEATKQDLLKAYGLIEAPIHVIHHGVSERFEPSAPRIDYFPDRYVLFVGHRHQYKDATVLFRAFASLATSDLDIALVCVGGDGLKKDEAALLQELGIYSRVHQYFLADGLMPSAYANAEVFVFPSHFEGFGLPALEAMGCGVPTILARATSLPEVAGEASIYFEPGAVEELADSMRAVLSDSTLRGTLIAAGLERSKHFTWQRTAELTAGIYEEALK